MTTPEAGEGKMLTLLFMWLFWQRPQPKVFVVDMPNAVVFTVPKTGTISTIHPSNGHFHFNPPLEVKEGDIVVLRGDRGE